MITPRLFITGGTGFIGGAFAARLIAEPQFDEALFLVRSKNTEEGLIRLRTVLEKHGVSPHQVDRLKPAQIVSGDLNQVSAWGQDSRLKTITHVLNSAAVASFGKHPSIWPTNVDGVIEMAGALSQYGNLKRFLHLGTAMACGAQAPTLVPEGYDAGESTEHFLQYTASKYEAERRLKEEFPELPLVVARPSIVVGHTSLGCRPSGSIYWVFRIGRALKSFTCELDQRIDVVPVDYCAEALHLLLSKAQLNHNSYHISSGPENANTFREIDEVTSKALGLPPTADYQRKSFEDLAQMQHEFAEKLGPCNRRIILKALRTYGSFAEMGMVFSNERLLSEGLGTPPKLSTYAGLCELTSRNQTIAEQMQFDYK